MSRRQHAAIDTILDTGVSRRTALRGLGGGLLTAAAVGMGRPGFAAARAMQTDASPVAGTDVTLEWLGWSHFRLTSPGGTVILLNPWVEGNPDAEITMDQIERADLILASQGHGDDQGNAVQLAIQTGATLFEPFELGTWMVEQGVPEDQVIRSGPGARLELDGITVQMVAAVHGSSVSAPTDTTPSVGISAGFVITFENGWTVYFDGNSAATQDMALWGRLYQPHAMLFNLGQRRSPTDAAAAISLVATDNPNLSTLIPHHHRVESPEGSTTVADVQAELDAMGVAVQITDPTRGEVYRFAV